MDLILLFMPSTVPLEMRCLVQARIPVEMRTKHADEFLERLQPRAHGRAHPFLQVVFGPLGLLVVPEQLEGFFKVVGAHDRRVPPHQC